LATLLSLRRGFMEKPFLPSAAIGFQSWKKALKTKFPTPFTHNRKPAVTKRKALSHKFRNACCC